MDESLVLTSDLLLKQTRVCIYLLVLECSSEMTFDLTEAKILHTVLNEADRLQLTQNN